jgi:hypothetical protein
MTRSEALDIMRQLTKEYDPNPFALWRMTKGQYLIVHLPSGNMCHDVNEARGAHASYLESLKEANQWVTR